MLRNTDVKESRVHRNQWLLLCCENMQLLVFLLLGFFRSLFPSVLHLLHEGCCAVLVANILLSISVSLFFAVRCIYCE